ncbi:MAG: hypothetical protein ACLR06_04570 [Christensenellaceae bacterium]
MIALIVAGGFLLLVFSFALGVYLRLPHVIAKKMQGSFESSELKKPDNYTLYRDRVKKSPIWRILPRCRTTVSTSIFPRRRKRLPCRCCSGFTAAALSRE